ncbi:alpha/beta fold hydrolase [uncultured Pseudokineococcus sp.]|uniref:alpha/beta fold hydrolase n=1 Tax=uncultured Pseudokineococcus sp. TaxID=1642928 RepID=UPI0026150439|nr:alpha/beta fold hydrolase [uncultured Pseudokineococcus sp.]
MSRRTGLEGMARQLARRDGHVVDRPLGSGASFPLTYVRATPAQDRRGLPVLLVPGGPGLASVLPYRGLRARAAALGLDALMVEHRGVGLSRTDARGADLPREAVTVRQAADDLAAVLDSAGVERAVVYGSSYGTHLAQALGARHPERVAAMVLDSPMLSVEDDLAANRAHRRRLLWDGEDPELAPVAAAVRALAARGGPMRELSHVVQVVFEFAGPDVLHRLLLARARGRLRGTWTRIAGLGAGELEGAGQRFLMEPDLVAGIAYGELGFGLPPDGGPLDPQLDFAEAAARQPRFTGEALDLPAALRRAPWPVVVVSGERDLRTPRPVARRAVDLAPDGLLVPLARTGHSALDTHQEAALHVVRAAADGDTARLDDTAALDALPRRGASRLVGTAISAVVRAATRPA